jgi:hypothetical protein
VDLTIILSHVVSLLVRDRRHLCLRKKLTVSVARQVSTDWSGQAPARPPQNSSGLSAAEISFPTLQSKISYINQLDPTLCASPPALTETASKQSEVPGLPDCTSQDGPRTPSPDQASGAYLLRTPCCFNCVQRLMGRGSGLRRTTAFGSAQRFQSRPLWPCFRKVLRIFPHFQSVRSFADTGAIRISFPHR